jgi:hypothetical protein
MRKTLLALQAAALLGGCSMPQTVVRTPESRPSLAVEGAPPGAILVVDGQPVGEARDYDARPLVLWVEPGTHAVEVRDPASGAVLHQQTVFVESELKTVKVH